MARFRNTILNEESIKLLIGKIDELHASLEERVRTKKMPEEVRKRFAQDSMMVGNKAVAKAIWQTEIDAVGTLSERLKQRESGELSYEEFTDLLSSAYRQVANNKVEEVQSELERADISASSALDSVVTIL